MCPPASQPGAAGSPGFQGLGICPEITEVLSRMGWEAPTAVQARAIPAALQAAAEGRRQDLVVLSETGSGKTGAFAIPILQDLLDHPAPFFCLIVSPTRELALQTAEVVSQIGEDMRVRLARLIGGVDSTRQQLQLGKKPHVVVCTPGRLLDHLTRTKGFSLDQVKYLVLDEADRLLDLDFARDLDIIISRCTSPERRTFLFSATMTPQVERLQRSCTQRPLRIEVSGGGARGAGDARREGAGGSGEAAVAAGDAPDAKGEAAGRITSGDSRDDPRGAPAGDGDLSPKSSSHPPLHPASNPPLNPPTSSSAHTAPSGTVAATLGSNLTQSIVVCPVSQKQAYLYYLLQENRGKRTLVFADKVTTVARLTFMLRTLGLETGAIHGQLDQERRVAALERFRSGETPVLVATDVASRGLDIQNVEVVINYDLPNVPADYVHRVGRTARAGRSGLALTLVTQYDIAHFYAIEELIQTRLDKLAVAQDRVRALAAPVDEALREAEQLMKDCGYSGNRREAEREKYARESLGDPNADMRRTQYKGPRQHKQKR